MRTQLKVDDALCVMTLQRVLKTVGGFRPIANCLRPSPATLSARMAGRWHHSKSENVTVSEIFPGTPSHANVRFVLPARSRTCMAPSLVPHVTRPLQVTRHCCGGENVPDGTESGIEKAGLKYNSVK